VTTLSERDLRSLERPRMYTIFKPLDPNEPLPRELLLAARRQRTVGRRELAGALWLPGLVAIMLLAQSEHLGVLPAGVLIALLLVGLTVFAFKGGGSK
jgi:hypothetical protein